MRSIFSSLSALLLSLLALAAPAAAQPANSTAVVPFPANGTNGVCPDTLLSLTFPAPPTLGSSGQVRIYDSADTHLVDTIDIGVPDLSQNYTIGGAEGFHLHPVLITGNVATFYPHHHVLDYHKTYSVQIDAGALQTAAGPFAGFNGTAWTFSTKTAPPAADASRLIVAADGSGDFATVQGALDFVPAHNTRPVTIFIQPGNYTEIVFFADKSNLTLLGADRDRTVISYANNDHFNNTPSTNEKPGPHFYHRSSFMGNHVTGIQIVNLTLKNTTPKGGSQAEALILSGGQNIVTQVNLSSLQDTLQINDSAYISDSSIEGDVDFMWGRGPVFFKNCHFLCLNRGYFTQIRNTSANHGFVYVDCTFDGTSNSAGTYLSRIDPGRFPNSEVVLINCALGAYLNPAAWKLSANVTAATTVHFWEYNSTNLSDGKPTDVSQRAACSKQLTLPQDAATIAQYQDPSFVLGGWSPAPIAIPAPAPAAPAK